MESLGKQFAVLIFLQLHVVLLLKKTAKILFIYNLSHLTAQQVYTSPGMPTWLHLYWHFDVVWRKSYFSRLFLTVPMLPSPIFECCLYIVFIGEGRVHFWPFKLFHPDVFSELCKPLEGNLPGHERWNGIWEIKYINVLVQPSFLKKSGIWIIQSENLEPCIM